MSLPSQQPRWDIFEAAILLEAVLNVNAHKEVRKEAIRRVSTTLRKLAKQRGLDFDETFRNENGITFQFQSMEFSALGKEGSTHKTGSKIFDKVVALYRDDTPEYNRILATAHAEAEGKVYMDNKTLFRQWLLLDPPKKHTTEIIIKALDDASDYCRSHGISKVSFWDIRDKSIFITVSSRLLGMRLYRLTHRPTATVLEKAVPLYRDFLDSINQKQISSQTEKVSNDQSLDQDVQSLSKTERNVSTVLEERVDMRSSLDKTIEYLKTRYEVRLHYDHLGNPNHSSNDMLYKVRNSKKDIMWVYYTDSKFAHYLSVETEPEYIEDISGKISGFYRTQIRASHPRQKMFFDDYEVIRESLVVICDSIDQYFAASAMSSFQEDRMKLYQKLYSISRVYDDPSGLSVSRIISMIGKETDENLVKDILDDASWATKLADDIYSFSRNTISAVREKPVQYEADSKAIVTDTAFYNYLHDEKGMADATCRSYVSAIRTAENFARNNGFLLHRIYNNVASESMQVIRSLLDSQTFLDFNTQQHNRFSAAFAKFSEFVGQTGSTRFSNITGQRAVTYHEPTDYSKEKFVQTLMNRYRNGMQFDSIDFDNFREMYETLFDESLSFTDQELEERLRFCGVFYKDRLFPAEGIIDSTTREKLFEYIDGSFSSGKKVLYYKAIFEDLASDFASCYTLSDENMLRAYIEFESEKDKYYFFSNYMSREKNVSIDHSAEVEEYFLGAGKPMATEDVCAALSHIPREQVIRIITTDSRFLRNAKGEYFHADIFEVSEIELERIDEIIENYINQNEYAIWTDIWNEIQEKMPVFLENNLYLSGLGIRNALARQFVGKFNFESAVISNPEDRYSMSDIYQLYAKHHSEFTADDIYYLSKELDTVIYFDALAEVSARMSHDLFISKDMIHFDVETVDKAIESFMSKDYIRIREIDSFLTFPNVGYEWNEYLLESFVYSYSNKFSLLNNGFSLNNVAGAIVKKKGSVQEFVDACAAILAEAPISLNKKDALNYLAEVNMITRRSYRDLDAAIEKANQIRARKG